MRERLEMNQVGRQRDQRDISQSIVAQIDCLNRRQSVHDLDQRSNTHIAQSTMRQMNPHGVRIFAENNGQRHEVALGDFAQIQLTWRLLFRGEIFFVGVSLEIFGGLFELQREVEASLFTKKLVFSSR